MRNYLILKGWCSKIYYVGSGNFWYEDGDLGKDNTLRYRLYGIALFSTYCFVTVLEIMAAIIGDFPDDEKSDSVTFAVSHSIVMIKLFSVIYNKETIKSLNHNMVKICEPYEEKLLIREQYHLIKVNVIAYFVTVYGSVVCYVFEGLRKIYEGNHFVTLVTYYPAYENDSVTATGYRVFTTIVLMMMMISMIVTVDCFTMVHLIIFKYKFITLRHYFEKKRNDYEKLSARGNERLATEYLTKSLIEGLKMHKDLLSVHKDIDKSFGTVMTMQLCQSSGSAVSLLLHIALSDQLTLVASMKIIFFVLALFFLLGLFLCNAGEITHQASLMSDAIFYCGWHVASMQPPRRCVRRIVLQAVMQAQRPLVMKAFKMIDLTYGTFLLVLRSTYSVFALFYAQNKKGI